MPRPSSDIELAAHEWLVMLSEAPSAAQRKAFAAWCQEDPQHQLAYERAESVWRKVDALEYEVLAKPHWGPGFRERAALVLPRTGWRGPVIAAVAMTIALAVTFVLLPPLTNQPDVPVELAINTEPAKVGRYELPDGSQLVLGAASSAEVSYSAKQRRLALLAGEAFVTVTPSADRPFLVVAGGITARATGTAYEVRERHDGFQVAVSEGHVSVYRSSDGMDVRRLNPGERVLAMQKGRGLVRLGRIEALPVEQVGAWQDHQLVYQAASLFDVVSDVNRYSSVPIEIADPSLEALRISATFEGTNPGFVLEALTEAFPVAVDRSDPEKIRLLAR